MATGSLCMWGRYEHGLDDKGRVIVPQKFRQKLGEDFVLTTGPGHHIRVYPLPVWNTMEEMLVGGELRHELDPGRNLLQRMFGNCEFASADPQHRVSLPRYLRDWAQLEDPDVAVILGAGNRLEIWSRPNWRAVAQGFTVEGAAQAAGVPRPVERGSDDLISPQTAVVEMRGDSVPSRL